MAPTSLPPSSNDAGTVRSAEETALSVYRHIAGLLPVAVIIADELGRLLEVNPTAEALLGPAARTLCTGQPLPTPWRLDLQDGSPLLPQDAPGVVALARGVRCGPQELTLHRPDGSLIRLHVLAMPLAQLQSSAPLPQHRMVMLVAQDETAHLQALDSLQAKNRRYQLAVVSGRLGVWEWDVISNSLHVDPILKQILGFSEDELPSTPEAWLARVHPEDKDRLLQLVQDCLLGAKDTFADEHRMRHKDGSVLWFLTRGAAVRDEAGTPLTLFGTHVDVTRARHVREIAAQHEQRARSITDNLPLGLAVINERRRIVLANPRLRAWYPHVDFDDHPSCRVLLPEGTPPCSPEDCSCFPADNACAPNELQLEFPEATGVRVRRFSFCPLQLAGGNRREVILLVEDVTEKNAVEVRLQRAQKLEAMGTLAAGIAHEINQPLNALQLYGSGLEMLLEKNPALPVATIRERVGLMLREANKVREIITHMRALSRMDTPAATQPVDVAASVRSALQLLRAQLTAHGIELQLDLAPDLPLTLCSPVQLEQAIINLVVNAMQAQDTLPADPNHPKTIQVRTAMLDGNVLISVTDNGPGLGSCRDRLFDPFFTTKESGVCMGLGLSIVHSLARSWGAEITAEALPEQGARFTLALQPAGDGQ